MTAHRDALVLEHLHLVKAVARHLHLDRVRRPVAPVDRDDYLAAGAEALVRAAQTWRPDAGTTFETYAWTVILRAMRYEQVVMRWRHYSRIRAGRPLVSLHASWDRWPDTPEATIADILIDPGDPYPAVEDRPPVLAAVERLRPPLRVVVELCWLQDLEQKEAAQRLGITQSAVSLRLRAARHVLARALASLVEVAEGVAA